MLTPEVLTVAFAFGFVAVLARRTLPTILRDRGRWRL